MLMPSSEVEEADAIEYSRDDMPDPLTEAGLHSEI